MAVYKVPQDVEADDKLIGPFSFRQFIYLIIVTLSIAMAWGLAQLFIPLAIIPLPVIVFFSALALPLRKDQPMEIYMAAILSFYLKPRKRLWEPDGIESLIEITVPKTVEVQRTKDISQTEAQRRFSYLAEIVDSQGWAIRGAGVQAPNSAMRSDVYFAAQQTEDILDIDNTVAQALNQKLDLSDAKIHKEMIDIAKGKAVEPKPVSFDYFSSTATSPGAPADPTVTYNPYPIIQQSIVQPTNPNEQIHETAPTTSEKPLAAGILNLASNTDLSIEAIAREANRIQKQDLSEEVVISLR